MTADASKLQMPNAKVQTNPKPENIDEPFRADLRFSRLDFFGVWSLAFGIF